MYFCNKCRYLYNVTKNIKDKQSGGKIKKAVDNILDKFLSNEKIVESDLKKITGKDILDDDRFEHMSKKDQKKLMSGIKSIDKKFFVEEEEEEDDIEVGTNTAYFICKFCKHTKVIKPGTLIFSKNYSGIDSNEIVDNSYSMHDPTLPRTRNYICQNKECKTHSDPLIKEAVIDKNSMYQIVYICTVCSTQWTNEL